LLPVAFLSPEVPEKTAEKNEKNGSLENLMVESPPHNGNIGFPETSMRHFGGNSCNKSHFGEDLLN